MPGVYWVDLYLGDEWGDLDVVREALRLEVVAADVFGSGRLPPPSAGPVFCEASWTLRRGPEIEAIESRANHESCADVL
jgi:hypothetical protein